METVGAAAPLRCIDTQNLTALGLPCEDCPLLPDCKALEAGQRIVALEAELRVSSEENERHELSNARLFERLLNLRLDALVETAFTPEGLKDHLMHDEGIAEELQQGNWGVVRLDGRFVQYINRFGNDVGDEFLMRGGREITAVANGLARFGSRRQQQELADEEHRVEQRRQGHSRANDIICRQGGDEFALLIRDVTPEQLAHVAARIQTALTVDKALERYAQGNVPFIASVGYAHAAQPDIAPEVAGQLIVHNDTWGAFKIINAAADKGQRSTKSRQYDEMWERTMQIMPADAAAKYIVRPSSDREVAALFLEYLCPEFQRDPTRFFVSPDESDRQS
jgi:GGDEF domain-containing protein